MKFKRRQKSYRLRCEKANCRNQKKLGLVGNKKL